MKYLYYIKSLFQWLPLFDKRVSYLEALLAEQAKRINDLEETIYTMIATEQHNQEFKHLLINAFSNIEKRTNNIEVVVSDMLQKEKVERVNTDNFDN